MPCWNIMYTDESAKDRDFLDYSVRRQVNKAIEKVAKNPLPKNEGGYGEPLGNKHGFDLTGLYKIKLKRHGIRIIYQLIKVGDTMQIIVIAARADDEVYKIAAQRLQ